MAAVLDLADARRAAVGTHFTPTSADVIRQFGPADRRQHGDRLHVQQDRALREIEIGHTATLGGQVRYCDACDQVESFYHSCRDRFHRRAAHLEPARLLHGHLHVL